MGEAKRHIPKIIFGIFVISSLILFFAFRLDRFFSLQNINLVREFILKFSIGGPLIVVLLFMIFNLVCLPTLYFNFLSGYLYGPLVGMITAWIGMTLGLMTSFLNVRWLFRRDFVEKFGSNRTVMQLEEYTEKYGSQLVVSMRLLFVIPYNIQNVAYGLSSIDPMRYLIFSAIGIIPLTLAYVWIGHLINLQVMGAGDFKRYSFIIGVLIAFFVVVIVMSIIIGKRLKIMKA
jgi:uncharacterized membrane protein YdjX (TVP38/TMEM64 family)